MEIRKLTIAMTLVLPLAAIAAPGGDPEDEPLKRTDLPLPIVIDESQGDVPITLDGETVNISGTVNASLNEPVEVEGTVNANISEPLEVTGTINALTPDPSIPISRIYGNFFWVEGYDLFSVDQELPDFLDAVQVTIKKDGRVCVFAAIAFDAANGEPGGGNPFVLLFKQAFAEIEEFQSQLFDYAYPGGIDTREWTEPTIRVAIDPEVSGDYCRAHVFLQGSNS